MTPHEDLPASYLASCEEFFNTFHSVDNEKFKRQASSSKHQAAGSRRDPDFLKKDKKDLTPTKSLI